MQNEQKLKRLQNKTKNLYQITKLNPNWEIKAYKQSPKVKDHHPTTFLTIFTSLKYSLVVAKTLKWQTFVIYKPRIKHTTTKVCFVLYTGVEMYWILSDELL